jgi:hypothetical protein
MTKELESSTALTVAIASEVENVQQIPAEYKIIGGLVPQIDGGIIWELNPETGEIKAAPLREVDSITYGVIPVRRVETRPGMQYVEALNKKNAARRFAQGRAMLST